MIFHRIMEASLTTIICLINAENAWSDTWIACDLDTKIVGREFKAINERLYYMIDKNNKFYSYGTDQKLTMEDAVVSRDKIEQRSSRIAIDIYRKNGTILITYHDKNDNIAFAFMGKCKKSEPRPINRDERAF